MAKIPYRKFRKSSILALLGILAGIFLIFNVGNLQDNRSFHLTERLGVIGRQREVVLAKAAAAEVPVVVQNKQDVKPAATTKPIAKETQSEGEELAKRIKQKCVAYLKNSPSSAIRFPITTNQNFNVMFCPMCKLASTYWTRFFTLLRRYDDTSYSNPYDIAMRDAPPTREKISIRRGQAASSRFNNYYKFLFIRDPYSRILSAYIDKVFAPNPIFWKIISRNQISRFRARDAPRAACHSDLTFEEYVRGIITNHKKPHETGKVDCHDESFTGACSPCEVQFDFVGKMENFTTDSYHLYRKLGMNRTIDSLKVHGKRLADDDALFDTVNGPFEWKRDIKKCISWRQALLRIWRKLQIRGVIGKQDMPLTDEEAEQITKEDFIKLVHDTQALTPYSERKHQRTEALREIFASVRLEYLKELKNTYKNDFNFFEYEPDNKDIFHFDRTQLEPYGYLDLND